MNQYEFICELGTWLNKGYAPEVEVLHDKAENNYFLAVQVYATGEKQDYNGSYETKREAITEKYDLLLKAELRALSIEEHCNNGTTNELERLQAESSKTGILKY